MGFEAFGKEGGNSGTHPSSWLPTPTIRVLGLFQQAASGRNPDPLTYEVTDWFDSFYRGSAKKLLEPSIRQAVNEKIFSEGLRAGEANPYIHYGIHSLDAQGQVASYYATATSALRRWMSERCNGLSLGITNAQGATKEAASLKLVHRIVDAMCTAMADNLLEFSDETDRPPAAVPAQRQLAYESA